MLARILEPIAWLIPRVARFVFLRPVFRNLWGVPVWTEFDLPWGTLGPMFSTFRKILDQFIFQMSKILEQYFDTS